MLDSKLNDYDKLLKKKINDLELPDQEKVKNYYNSFIRTISDSHLSASIINSG